MRFTILVTMLVVSAGAAGRVSAQTPSGAPPPSFGTDTPLGLPLQDFEMRRYRDWQLTVNVTVPTSELQAVLPVGYKVLNPAAASSNVSIALVFQERAEILAVDGVAPGSYGPVDEVLVVAAARSPMGIVESLILDNLRSTQDAVNLTNTIFGPGSARLPDLLRVKLTAEPGGETLRFSARVVSGRLHIAAAAVFSPSGMTIEQEQAVAGSVQIRGQLDPTGNREPKPARGDERRSGDRSGRRHHLQAGPDSAAAREADGAHHRVREDRPLAGVRAEAAVAAITCRVPTASSGTTTIDADFASSVAFATRKRWPSEVMAYARSVPWLSSDLVRVRNRRRGGSKLNVSAAGPDGHGHQRPVRRHVNELMAIAAPLRLRPAVNGDLAANSGPVQGHAR